MIKQNISRPGRALLLLSSVLLLVGCGTESATVPVSGTVTYNDEPVTQGRVMFVPISQDNPSHPGKSAYAEVAADGTFTLTTYEEGDGAIAGTHRVTYELGAAPAGEYRDGKQHPPSAEKLKEWQSLRGVVPQTPQVEVAPGSPTTVNIQLGKRP